MKPRFARIVDNRERGTLASQLRLRRHRLFQTLLSEFPSPVRVLDIGGTPEFWESLDFTGDASCQITVLNIDAPARPHPKLSWLAGDATHLDDIGDRAFDVVFSNSVIEHLGNREAQESMALEVQRVGRAYFIQTPNRWFPIEPHFLVPGFQFLPEDVRVGLVRRFAMGWYPSIPDSEKAREFVNTHRLLGPAEMLDLFPGATLRRERVFLLTKSLIAMGRSPDLRSLRPPTVRRVA